MTNFVSDANSQNMTNSVNRKASSQTIEAGIDLESARQAFETALNQLLQEFPDLRYTKTDTVELREEHSLWDWFQAGIMAVLSLFRLLWGFIRGIWLVIALTIEDIRALLNPQRASLEATQKSVEARRIQTLLLEALWARDHIQYMLQQAIPVPYEVKRDSLQYLNQNDDLLDQLRREAIERFDLDPVALRKSQPTSPPPEAWWWFIDHRRERRTRQLNAFWFIAAIFPALAAIILITLLTQRLAISGLDILSGASVVAQMILGGGTVLAVRELLNAFLLDRSSGRSWQGEISFVLASLFLVVIVGFYYMAPPAAAEVYNFFGQRAIESGNAAEAELYLESATRLDPDPHAGNLAQVGCLYLSRGAPERAQGVFERVLEADSRLLIARYHLAGIYTDQAEFDTALQLISDGLNLLDTNEERLVQGEDLLLPRIDNQTTTQKVRYLLRLAFGEAYLGVGSFQQAKFHLLNAEALLLNLQEGGAVGNATRTLDIPCLETDEMNIFLANSEMDLKYFEARTFDAICASDNTNPVAVQENNTAAEAAWREVLVLPVTTSIHANYKAEAELRLRLDCTDLINGRVLELGTN
jgi:tetratricopeptide (TPR) repeat protein